MRYNLDIGSGSEPNIECNIFLDRYFEKTFHRHNQTIKIMPMMVKGDALFLPFRDKSINYVYSKDVIEHLDDPKKFIKECNRVSNNIDIFTNTIFSEIHAFLFYDGANKGHKWAYDPIHKTFINLNELRKDIPQYTKKQRLLIKLIRLLPIKIRCKVIDSYFFIMDTYLQKVNVGLYSSHLPP